MSWQYLVSHSIKMIKYMMRLDLIISVHIKEGRLFVQKIKNELLILQKKGESDWHQTSLLHKKLKDSGNKVSTLYGGGGMIMTQKHYIQSRYPLTDQEKRKASSPKQAFRNYATHTLRKLLQNVIKCFLAPIKIVKVSFFPVSNTPRVAASNRDVAKSKKNIIYDQS